MRPRSTEFFDETERPGQPFPVDTHMIIRDRYEFAAELAKGQRVLEIGCGAGFGLQHLASVAESLHAVEYSTENLELLRSNFGDNFAVAQADAHALPFAAGQFDLVIAMAMVYYLDMVRFLTEVHRVLSADGVLLFCTSNKDVPGFVTAPHTTGYFSVPELKRAVENAGFECQILGAFPAKGKLSRRRVRAWIKNVIKIIVTKLPGGELVWRSLRQRTHVDVRPLPRCFTEMERPDATRLLLETDRPDRTHRVIYAVSKRKAA
jgi:ubiquinone/menaquinone biosynthesis C-methylase UbiE